MNCFGATACQPGKSFPLGATPVSGGANFSVFSKHSTGAQLLLFDDVDTSTPSRIIDLDPRANRTYHYWHVFVPGVTAGQIYAYRIAGPFAATTGAPKPAVTLSPRPTSSTFRSVHG